MTTIWVLAFGAVIGVAFVTLFCLLSLGGAGSKGARSYPTGTRIAMGRPSDDLVNRDAQRADDQVRVRFREWLGRQGVLR